MKEFFSHTSADKNEYLIDHLYHTGDLASFFASSFGGSRIAEQAGLLHDLGKHTEKFQNVLDGTAHNIDHSVVGAEYYWNNVSEELIDDPYFAQVICNVIQSHHSDLHGQLDEEAIADSEYMAYPNFSRKRNITDNHKENALGSEEELEQIADFVNRHDLLKRISGNILPNSENMSNEAKMLYERMIFSCLVDADYSSTAAFYDLEDYSVYKAERVLNPDRLIKQLEDYRDKRGFGKNNSGLNSLRNHVYRQCEKAGRELPVGLYTLTAPTGTGKTHPLIKFALEQAKRNNQKRIFVVLPYLSIIEQNASEYREIFGDENCIEQDSQTDISDEIKLYADRWDYPIIVTTSVSFFETLCGGQASKERKLHNITDAVIVFDEAQTLPSYLLDVTMKSLEALPVYFNTTVLLSTATQPDYKLRKSLKDLHYKEIMPDCNEMYKGYGEIRRLAISTAVKPPETYEELVDIFDTHQQLFVFNTTGKALKMFEELKKRYDEKDCFLLSSALCSEHKSDTIREIKERIAHGLDCYVSATQCIEAGVDLDFPSGMRECAPLPSVIQTAGRINRNGKSIGEFHVFVLDDNAYPGTVYRNESYVTRNVIQLHGLNINDLHLIGEYYREIYSGDAEENADKNEIVEAVEELDTHKLSEKYKLIEDKDELNIIVPYKRTEFEDLYTVLSSHNFCISKKVMKAASHMTVRLYGNKNLQEYLDRHCKRLLAKKSDTVGYVEINWYIVEELSIYDQKKGLIREEREGGFVF